MGSFQLNVDKERKVFYVEVEGSFSPQDGLAAIEAYKNELAAIHAAEYDLDLDCTKLNVSAPEALPLLEGSFALYKADGFKKITFRIASNPVLKMQLSRVARKVDLPNAEIIEV